MKEKNIFKKSPKMFCNQIYFPIFVMSKGRREGKEEVSL